MKQYTAIVLAAGAGKRMNCEVRKQYLLLHGKPVLSYALEAFEKSEVNDIVLVVGSGEAAYCQEEIVGKYGFQKVRAIVEGGKERYHSVYEGLKQAAGADYVLIHDGARPLVTPDMIRRCMQEVERWDACVVGMPVKDTIKMVDAEGFAECTPERSRLWQIQTPQTFAYPLIWEAYQKIMSEADLAVTDDAMVLEHTMGCRVKVMEGSYHNIKITTPEDLLVAEAYLRWSE
ncbi:MAG: 2-C-methyl-D-erythritol 4-phosphate cytidylyltransferase [Clostridiales bacterium]|nr:2-C-methyl-D-erythritol 4-phosphate cytidylyltransferase [Clostridiales bacterium]